MRKVACSYFLFVVLCGSFGGTLPKVPGVIPKKQVVCQYSHKSDGVVVTLF